MPVELFFSNQLEHLAEKLAAMLSSQRHANTDPFTPIKIIVPNANLAKWLTLVLARRDSIVMNIDFQFLEAGLWELLAALDPYSKPIQRLDKTKARLLILTVLTGLDKKNPALTPVIDYLFDPNGSKYPDYTLRLWQLSDRLAHLFLEYEYHRSDMIQRWINEDDEADEIARCEQQIYIALMSLKADLESRHGESIMSLMAYAKQIFKTVPTSAGPNTDQPRIHLFGLSQVSAFHLSVMDRLAPHYSLSIYALNPTREFWEDIRTPAEKRWMKYKNRRLSLRHEEVAAGELFALPDHPLLAAWGKPGRESVRLLCQLTDYTFQAGFGPVISANGMVDSVLKFIQLDILTLGNDSRLSRLNQDRSLQIYGCPSIQREVETVYQSICFNLAQNNRLQLSDFAVLVPDISQYKPGFELIFNRLPRQLTYNLVDTRADIESVYGQAVLALLKLSTGRFTRKQVFELILNPCFRHRWHLEVDAVRIWAEWAEALNILHQFERKDSEETGGPPSGRYTFKQGLQRLRLARIFSSQAVGDTQDLHFENLTPFADTNSRDDEILEKFCLAIEALDRAAHTLHLGQTTAAHWRSALLGVTGELLSIPPDYRSEAAVRQAMISALDEMTLLDRLSRDEDTPLLEAALVAEYLRFGLGAISGSRGDYLTEGVTISELTPMRPIPFKIIYILGMQEGGFPGRADHSLLDLRHKQRRIGDITLPERNRYLFLETLLAAREKLYVSYLNRDLQKDRTLPVGTVVNQLKQFVEQSVLPDGKTFLLGSIPLKSSSAKYLRPDAVNAWSDVRINNNLIDRVAAYRSAGIWYQVETRLDGTDLKRIARLNPDLAPPQPTQTADAIDPPADIEIQLEFLSRFLKDPLQVCIRRHLGIFDEVPGLEEQVQFEDEPFVTPYPLSWRLKMEPLRQWLDRVFETANPTEVQAAIAHDFDRLYDNYYRKSATPQTTYSISDKRALKEVVTAIQTEVAPLIDRILSAADSLTAAIIGAPQDWDTRTRGGRYQRFEALTRPISFQERTVGRILSKVSLHGQLRWLWREKESGWHVLLPAFVNRLQKQPSKHLLSPILFYLTGQMGPESRAYFGNDPLTIHLTTPEKSIEFTFQADKQEAEAYLSHLIAAALEDHRFLYLPFETMVKSRLKPLTLDSKNIDASLRTRFRTEVMEAFMTQADEWAQLIDPSFPQDLLDQAVKRFDIFGKIETNS